MNLHGSRYVSLVFRHFREMDVRRPGALCGQKYGRRRFWWSAGPLIYDLLLDTLVR